MAFDVCLGGMDLNDGGGMLASLPYVTPVRIYFPANLKDKPVCLVEGDEALVLAAEAANERLCPLASNSVLAVVKTVLACVKREMLDTSWGRRLVSVAPSSPPDAAVVGALAILAAIREDPVGADLALALLSMAVSSYRRDTVSVPFPNQLESAGGQRAYAAFLSSLEALPTMSEMSRWVDPAKVLELPHMAVLGLHFVLAYLPTKLRLATYAESVRLTTGPGHGSGPGPNLSLALGKSSPCLVQGTHPRAGNALAAAPGHGMSAGDSDPILTPGIYQRVFDVILPCDPTFDAEAKRNGSVVAYYGSSPDRFHSVLNTGLLARSGPRLLKHGAVFGEGIHVSVSLDTAALFAARGDGRGVSVWPKSTFGQVPGFETGPVLGNDNPPHVRRPKIFRHRIVAKCRILKGDGVKEVKGWDSKEGYFVVSDPAKVRVEGLVLLDIGMSLAKKHAVLSHEVLKPVDEVSVNEKIVRSTSSFGRCMVRRSGSRDEQTLSQAISGRGDERNSADALLGWIKFLSGVLLVGMVPITVGVVCLLYMERLA